MPPIRITLAVVLLGVAAAPAMAQTAVRADDLEVRAQMEQVRRVLDRFIGSVEPQLRTPALSDLRTAASRTASNYRPPSATAAPMVADFLRQAKAFEAALKAGAPALEAAWAAVVPWVTGLGHSYQVDWTSEPSLWVPRRITDQEVRLSASSLSAAADDLAKLMGPPPIRYPRFMGHPAHPALAHVLDGLMRRYQAHVPDVGAVVATMVRHGLIPRASDIENDHIAFRTLGVPCLGIASLERVFLHYGYERRDRYDFPAKKVSANWYAPPAPSFPRIFISELRVPQLSEGAQAIIHSYTNDVDADPVDRLDLDSADDVVAFLHAPLWRTPTWADYQRLRQESEFAAWVIYNRYYLNHFTVSIHNLPVGWNTLDAFNRFLESNGFTLNDSGGKAKVSADGKLLQSSTVAAMVDAAFDDGAGGTEVHQIPGSYVEFAERRVLDEFAHLPAREIRREHRREGFEAASADKIFESTYTAQAARRHR